RRPLLPAGAHGNWRAGGLHDAHSAARSLSLHLARRRGWHDREGMALRTAWRRRPGPRRRPGAGLDRWGLGERVGESKERTGGGLQSSPTALVGPRSFFRFTGLSRFDVRPG